MQTVVEGLRQVIGVPNFYIDGSLDYGLAVEYMVAAVIVAVVVSSVFKIVVRWFER